MNRQSKNNFVARILICALAVFALNGNGIAQDLLPENYSESLDHQWALEKINPDDDWTRHFRIGGVVGFNIKGSFNSPGTFNIAPHKAGVYDDGYVHLDSRNDPTETSYFGYDNASQYNGSTLTMHSANSISVTGGGTGSGSAGTSLGFDLAYGDSYWYWAQGKLGWEFGLGLLPVHIANTMPITSATVTRSVYQFDASGNPIFAPPGYRGVFENDNNSGNVWNIGPTPAQQPDDTISGSGTSTGTLDVMLYTARLGPTLYWDWDEHFGFYAGAGPAIGFVSGNLGYNQNLLLNDGSIVHNHGQINGTSLTYGGYVNATLVYHAVEGGDFYLGAQFMPLSSATISGGGRSGKLDLGGQLYITAGINWPF